MLERRLDWLTMTESGASLFSQTADEELDLIVATTPRDVMQRFEVERECLTGSNNHDQNPHISIALREGLHHICPYKLIHLFAVTGLLVAGVFVGYLSVVHIGRLSAGESSMISFTGIPVSPVPVNVPSPATLKSPGSNTTSVEPLSAHRKANTSDFSRTDDNVTFHSPIPVASLGSETNSGFRDSKTSMIYFQNMSETWHSMSDKDLLKKASSSQSLRGAHVTRIAYMFMTRGPLPFAPLWERYFRGHESMWSIYIHAHPHYVPTMAPGSPFFHRFVPSKIVEWGKLSVYEAERRLLGNALLEQTNKWFVLLSESCIPVFSFPDTYKYFNYSQESFLESYVDPGRHGQGRLYREDFKHMAPEITSENFRKGSQWFQINRDLALVAVANSKEYAKFEKYFCRFRSVCYIDEHCLPTLAWIIRPQALAYRTLTFYQFNGKSAHPKLFRGVDTDAKLILWFREGHNCTYNGQPTSKCYLFVRKFHSNALDALLALAGPVMRIH